MALQLPGIMKNPNHVDCAFAPAVDQKMPGFSDNAQVFASPIPAEEQVISPDARRQLPPFSRARPLRIGRDVANRLLQEITVASC